MSVRGQNRKSPPCPKRQIDQIRTSIEAFGFTNPILADPEGHIIAGHGRLQAARLMGLAPRNGRLRKIPKKVQEFSLHLSLTGPVLGQGNGSIILVSDNSHASFGRLVGDDSLTAVDRCEPPESRASSCPRRHPWC